MTHLARVTLGNPQSTGTTYGGYDNMVIPVFVEVRNYGHYKAKLTYLRNKVATVTDPNQIQIIENPTAVNISDFTVSTTVSSNYNLRVTGTGTHYITGSPVGIGTTNPSSDAALTVGGLMRAQELRVTIDAGADYIFDEDFNNRNLSQLEKYIHENKHLPDIPSETEMIQQGLNMGEFQIQLLQKIEELTLYIIEQDKKLNRLNDEIEKLKNTK